MTVVAPRCSWPAISGADMPSAVRRRTSSSRGVSSRSWSPLRRRISWATAACTSVPRVVRPLAAATRHRRSRRRSSPWTGIPRRRSQARRTRRRGRSRRRRTPRERRGPRARASSGPRPRRGRASSRRAHTRRGPRCEFRRAQPHRRPPARRAPARDGASPCPPARCGRADGHRRSPPGSGRSARRVFYHQPRKPRCIKGFPRPGEADRRRARLPGPAARLMGGRGAESDAVS